ncbi:unnamed protein product [Caenorhabditis sp. 36 PRJEB53466]|nr:unnamed protein product [Caenorhabditis sp. 36 PRJEB53466]
MTAATANGSHSIENSVVVKAPVAAPVQENELFEELYQMECFRTGEFYLKSGQMTPIYIDLRRIMSSPRVLRMAAQAMCDKIVAKNLKFDYVVGVPYAALPLATLVSDILNVPMLMKRKEAKAYGTKQLIEGVYQPGGTVLLVEDVVTSGESIRETAEAVRKENLNVTDTIAVLDRQQGATANLAADKLNFLSFLTMEGILDGLIRKNQMTEQRKCMFNWLSIVLAVVITTPTLNSKEKYDLQKTDMISSNRFERSDTALSKVLGWQMTLGRVTNVIYLQNKLLDGSLTAEDVVVGIWNLKDKGAVQKFHTIQSTNLTALLEELGIEVTKKLYTNATQLFGLSSSLKSMFAELEKFKQLKDVNKAELKKALESLSNLIRHLSETSSTPSIAPAFLSDRNLSQIYDDLENRMMAELLNQGNPLDKLITGLKDIGQLVTNFEAIVVGGSLLGSMTSKFNVARLMHFCENIEKYIKGVTKVEELSILPKCITISSTSLPSLLGDLDNIVEKVANILDKIEVIVNTLDEWNDMESDIKELGTFNDFIQNLDYAQFANYKNSTSYVKGTSILEKFISIFNKTLLDKEITDNLSELISKMQEAQEWIKNTGLQNEPCSINASFDVNPLIYFNLFVEEVESVKKLEVVDAVSQIYNTFTLTAKRFDAISVTAIAMKSNKSEDSTQLYENFKSEASLDALLQTAAGAGSLNQIYQFQQLKSKVELIINAEPTVQSAISLITDNTTKAKLEKTWKTFPAVKRQLTELLANVANLENVLHTATITKSMDSAVKVYKLAENMNFAGQIDLRNLRESMFHFETTRRKRAQPNQDLQGLSDSLEALLQPIDLSLAHANFQKTPRALAQLQNDFNVYFGISRGSPSGENGEGQSQETGSDWTWYAVGGGVGLIVIVVVIIVVVCKKRKKKMQFMDDPYLHEEPDYKYTEEWYRFNFVQLQDSRWPINQKDKNNKTALYRAVENKNFAEVQKLLDEGALIDATCDKYEWSALRLLVDRKEKTWGLKFCDYGADISQPDTLADTADMWGANKGFMPEFDDYYGEKKRKRTIPPNKKRTYKVLVLDPNCLTKFEMKKLTPRIKDKITWGYKEGMNLDTFTHIVVSSNYTNDNNLQEFYLPENDDFLAYEMIASLANLMGKRWLLAILDNTDNIQLDHPFILTDIRFRKYTERDALLRLKTYRHQGLPKFLCRVTITILPTKTDEAAKKEKWKKIIKLFGGTVSEKPKADTYNCEMPFHACWSWYRTNKEDLMTINYQNSCWILRYKDSEIDPIWRSNANAYTLVDFNFLRESIARGVILNSRNTIVPLELDHKEADDKERPVNKSKKQPREAKAKATEASTGVTKS